VTIDLRDSTVLVTGGRGFIGGAVCHKLNAAGANIFTLSRSESDAKNALSVDLTDEQATLKTCRSVQPDFIIHLASHVVGHRTPEVVSSTFHNNTTSTVNLLLAAAATNCQNIVLTGSLEEPDPDSDWSVPSSPYAASKLAANSYGRMFAALFELSVTILRVFMVYGPGQADTKKLVPYVITSLLRDEKPSFSSGTRLVDWIHVNDVADAYVAALTQPSAIGKTFDVGSGQLTSVRDVISTIFELMNGDTDPEFGGTADRVLEQVRTAKLQPAEEFLNWKPRFELRDGLQNTIDWYKKQPL